MPKFSLRDFVSQHGKTEKARSSGEIVTALRAQVEALTEAEDGFTLPLSLPKGKSGGMVRDYDVTLPNGTTVKVANVMAAITRQWGTNPNGDDNASRHDYVISAGKDLMLIYLKGEVSDEAEAEDDTEAEAEEAEAEA